jgi:23S rRNA-/tRNA-specific pseudouridylate synthase
MTKIRNEGKRNTYRGKQHVKKSRSKRNRQRPKGGIGIVVGFDTDISATAADRATSPQVQIDILPLKFPGDDVNTNNRVRVVRPYPFTFATFAKERWLGRTVLDIYSKEFGSYPTCYYKTAINEGRILVNGEKIDCEYKVKGNDELAHVVHRHEPVVAISPSIAGSTSQKPYIHIVHEDGNIIVVDKPSTLPVHPCGGYNLNSLFNILADQCPELKDNLFTVHRLDRLTSGLTIIAKNTETAKILGKCITDRDNCHKVYLARVKGKFPLQAPSASRLTIEKSTVFPLNGEWFCPENEDKHGTAATCFWMSDKSGKADAEKSLTDVFENRTDISKLREDGTADDSLWLNLSVPVEIIDPKKGVCKAGNGKVAQTAFTVVGYDEETDSTLVLAKPMTG